MNQHILNSIEKASNVIGKTWPLYSFVASNPLSGYENSSFEEAARTAQQYLNANAFPSAKLYRQAFVNGAIDQTILERHLREKDFMDTIEVYLDMLESQKQISDQNVNQEVDLFVTKWLSAFLDEGLAEWDMPYKSEGFYAAWRLMVIYDTDIEGTHLKEIPKTSIEAVEQALKEVSTDDYTEIFRYHLAALPGWTGYINHRTQSDSEWQTESPITLLDYLAVRLWASNKMNVPLLPEVKQDTTDPLIPELQYIWLKAWEESWQDGLVTTLEKQSISTETISNKTLPDAQMVFCIDTRSELIRRHVESKGNYETYGYAGFFGIAMDYKASDAAVSRKSCPPIVSSTYTVIETPQREKKDQYAAFEKKHSRLNFGAYFLKRMKNMLPSAFGYVEGAGFFYGLTLFSRTFLSKVLYRINQAKANEKEMLCEPQINKSIHENVVYGIPLAEKVSIVKSAFDLMGWKHFAPLVLFVGHGSHSANNPFGSSLDCGACAASPGRHNARMLAKLANLQEVRQVLEETYGLSIPESTVFIGAEHITTTDEIILFDSGVPKEYNSLLYNLKKNLSLAQRTAAQNRLGDKGNSIALAHKKAKNWNETRPEWGLAKNAGFIIGPRELTKNSNLDSRCFLHSYDWEMDTSGNALAGIMQGPMVVTQWINNHYYFSTVDNNKYGGGSKIAHNITGKFGVVEGNGGDLKMGLPLQSLFGSDDDMYHQPLRLTVMIQAPTDRVSYILNEYEHLRSLLDNEWIFLMVMDPTQNNEIFKYQKSMKWTPNSRIEKNHTEQRESMIDEMILA